MATEYDPSVIVAGQIHVHLENGGSLTLDIGGSRPIDLLTLSDPEFDLLSDLVGLVTDHVKATRKRRGQ
jgi:hypothetical protein